MTETALATALNMAFLASVSRSSAIVMGAALLLTGIGFLVLTLGGAVQRAPSVRETVRRTEPAIG